MGNHVVGKLMGLKAEELVRRRQPGETALDLLDAICTPYRNTDAEFEAEDPYRPGFIHPEFSHYTDPHPKAALGMLMVEAFAPNGLADIPRYAYLVKESRAPDAPYDEAADIAAVDAWWSEVKQKFKARYKFW